MMAGYSLLAICISLDLIRISHPFHSRHRKVWIIRIMCLIVMAIMPIFWADMNQFLILVVIMACIIIQVFVDEEGQREKQVFKEERKEKAKEASARQLQSTSSLSHGGDDGQSPTNGSGEDGGNKNSSSSIHGDATAPAVIGNGDGDVMGNHGNGERLAQVKTNHVVSASSSFSESINNNDQVIGNVGRVSGQDDDENGNEKMEVTVE